jgi:hypothetical protein
LAVSCGTDGSNPAPSSEESCANSTCPGLSRPQRRIGRIAFKGRVPIGIENAAVVAEGPARQLGGEGWSTWDTPPGKQSWMRWPTYERKYERWEPVVEKANEEFTIRAARLLKLI